MIAESTPFGGINLNTTETIKYNETDPWDRWFRRVIDLIEEYDIDMFSYINCNWESQQMWHHTGFGDTRLSVNKEVMDKWNRIILGDEGRQRFLQGGELTCAEAKETFHEELDKDFEADDYISFVVLAVLLAALVVLSRIYSPSKTEVKDSEKTPLKTKRNSSVASKSVNSSYHSLKSGSYSLTGYDTPGDLIVHQNLSQLNLSQQRQPLMMQEYMSMSGASLTGRINSGADLAGRINSVTSMHSVTTSSMHGRVNSNPSIRGRVESNSSVKSIQSIYTNGKQQMHGPVQSNSSLYARSN